MASQETWATLATRSAPPGLMTSCALPESFQTSVAWRTSSSVKNSATRVASAGRERVVQQHHHRPIAAGVGIHETGRRRPLQLHPETLLVPPRRDAPAIGRHLGLSHAEGMLEVSTSNWFQSVERRC